MVKHTFLDKCCTIIRNSKLNTGLNPVAELNYGTDVTRALIHFDVEELKKLVGDGTYAELGSLRHILKLTNCGSVNNDLHRRDLVTSSCKRKERATSFDVILFKVPMEWDNGKGIDFMTDFWITDNHKYSEDGCNWYKAANGYDWDEEGIYSSQTLSKEYDKFSAGEESVIISRQRFDIGNENFEFDLTDYVNGLIEGKEENFGLCLAFSPLKEMTELEVGQYIGFFGPYTNTFFHPYLETVYEEQIRDDRDSFHIGKKCRLYLYTNEGNVEGLPTCRIDGLDVEPEVKMQTKGTYYAEFTIKKGQVPENTILYDIWEGLVVDGEEIEPVEGEFVVLPPEKKFGFSRPDGTYVPYASGMNDDEKISIGEVRRIWVTFRKKYSTNQYKVFDDAEYRLYCMDGSKELVVFDYQPIDKYFEGNCFTIDTNSLVPNRYIVDIRRGENYFRDVLRFEVVSNVNNKYI